MTRPDFSSPRLYVPDDLKMGAEFPVNHDAANYLQNVLRLGSGAKVLVFNGRDGEWLSQLAIKSRKETRLEILSQTRPQPEAGNLHYAFAPIKHTRLDFMIQKSVEMGASRLTPVITGRTQVSRVNVERMRSNVIEAAQQCGVLALPEVEEPTAFSRWLAAIPAERAIVFCDEAAETADPLEALARAPSGPLTLVIGPEGGFDDQERGALLAHSSVIRLSLGPRVLRADTAAIAVLAILQAVRGDWR
jgi:16S rRNA (uracil1498-N3)-methyltransferase